MLSNVASISTRKAVEYSAALLVIGVVFIILLGPFLTANFPLNEDQQILEYFMPPTAHPQPAFTGSTQTWDLITRVAQTATQIGRFTPFGHLMWLGRVRLLGPNPTLWYLVSSCAGVLTCWLLYMGLRELRLNIVCAAFAILVLVTYRDALTPWYILENGEIWGNLMVALALFAAVRAAQGNHRIVWDSFLLIAVALAGWSKESFILTIPAILLARLALQAWFQHQPWGHAFKSIIIVAIIGSLIFAVQLGIIGLFMIPRYNSLTAGSSTPLPSGFSLSWLRNFLSASPPIGSYVPLVLAVVIVLVARRASPTEWHKRIQYMAAGVLVFLGWVVPQFYLYSQSLGERYWYPAIIGIAIGMAISLMVIWQSKMRPASILVGLVFLITLPFGYLNLIRHSGEMSWILARTHAVDKAVQVLRSQSDPTRALVIAASPLVEDSKIYHLTRRLRFYGVENPIYLYPLFHNSAEAESQFGQNALSQFAGYTTRDLQGDSVSAILWMEYNEVPEHDAPVWLVNFKGDEKLVIEPVYRPSITLLPLSKVADLGIKLSFNSQVTR